MKKVLSVILAIVLIAAPLTVAASATSEIPETPVTTMTDQITGRGASPADGSEGMGANPADGIIIARFAFADMLENIKSLLVRILDAIIDFIVPAHQVDPTPITPENPSSPEFFYLTNVSLNDENIFAGYQLDKENMRIALYDCTNNHLRFTYSLPTNWNPEDTFVECASPEIIVINCNGMRVYLNTLTPLDFANPYFLALQMLIEYNSSNWKGEEAYRENTVITMEKVEPFEGRDTIIKVVASTGKIYRFLLEKNENGQYYLP